ncbi:hypothetical protein BGZ63DRAFT_461473 [Mariannaea sp. PMI_226]|nr:hypothetical protein BGZ63DRAFT_461473 [Mariannaea sp. PMI_226]
MAGSNPNDNKTPESPADAMASTMWSFISGPGLDDIHNPRPGGFWQADVATHDGFILKYYYYPVDNFVLQSTSHHFRPMRTLEEVNKYSQNCIYRYRADDANLHPVPQNNEGFPPSVPSDGAVHLTQPATFEVSYRYDTPPDFNTTATNSDLPVSPFPMQTQFIQPGSMVVNQFVQHPQQAGTQAPALTSNQNASFHGPAIGVNHQTVSHNWAQLQFTPHNQQNQADQNNYADRMNH